MSKRGQSIRSNNKSVHPIYKIHHVQIKKNNIRTDYHMINTSARLTEIEDEIRTESDPSGNRYIKKPISTKEFHLIQEGPYKDFQPKLASTPKKQRPFLHDGSKGIQKCVKTKIFIYEKYRTVILKKLKFGMYLYGCDFKKIARVLWPQEKHMTAQALHSIYKKYIAKRT